MAPKRRASYIITYFIEDDNGKVLLGKEAVLSKVGVRSLNSLLRDRDPKIKAKRRELYDRIRERKQVIDDEGRLLAEYSALSGRNLNGALLIGRTAYVGGGIERKDTCPEQAGIRELCEEFCLDLDKVDMHELETHLVPVCQMSIGRHELFFFSLDLNSLQEDYLRPRAIMERFNCLPQPSITEMLSQNCRDMEKRELLIANFSEFEQLLSKQSEEDYVHNFEKISELARLVYDKLSLEFKELEGGTEHERAVQHLRDSIVAYQSNRPIVVEPASKFIESFTKK